MAEIKPIDLPEVRFDPMRGLPQQETLAERLRKSADQRFARSMQKYNMRKLAREEKNYAINKRAENYIFSHYPSSTVKGDFKESWKNRRFGPGSYDAELKKWKENVGGNYQAFRSYYEASKQAEDEALYKSIQRNPAIYKSEKAYKKAISDWMNGMSEEEQQDILNNAPGAYRQIIYDNWSATNEKFFDRLGRNLGVGDKDADDDSILPELGLGTVGAIGTYIATRGRVKPKSTGKIARAFDKISGRSGRMTSNLKGFESDAIKKKAGKFSKVQKEMDELNIVDQQGYQKFKGMKGIPHRNIPEINKEAQKLVKQGMMNKADADNLKGVIDKLMRSGKEVTAENIGEALRKGGDKFDSLRKTLGNFRGSALGPIRMSGLIAGMAGYPLASMGASALAEQAGVEEPGQTIAGVTAGTLMNNPMGMYNGIKTLIDKKGRSYVMKKVMQKGGAKLLGSVALKTLLGGTGVGAVVAGGLLLSDLYTIYDILKDDMEP